MSKIPSDRRRHASPQESTRSNAVIAVASLWLILYLAILAAALMGYGFDGGSALVANN
jgi:hypothetical protein